MTKFNNVNNLKVSRKFLSELIAITVVCVALLAMPVADAQEIDFENDVLPILEDNCMHCHGEDEQESGFRLDSRVGLLKGGDYGDSVLVPGHPEKSSLVTVIEYGDPDFAMPPDGKMDDQDIAIVKKWVQQGAVWPGQMDDVVVREKSDHWAYQSVTRPQVPTVESGFPVHNPVDRFLQASLLQNGITPSAEADPRSLIRRAAITLTGIPPTQEEVEKFETAYEKDSKGAYAGLVDRLMASPHFGERWAQHWLDVIRWAETNGSESNMYRKNAWVYRDYVIDAFNNDKSYDQFIAEQLAGDTMGAGEATGFLVAGPHVPAATVGREPTAQRQARADRLDEVLQTVGASMMGVTIGCARCHNHKFDPISINDYYSMSAAFEDVEFGSRLPEYKDDHPRQQRLVDLEQQIRDQRALVKPLGPWVEKTPGLLTLYFAPKKMDVLRIEFLQPNVRIDELEVFGPDDPEKNLVSHRRSVSIDQNADLEVPGNSIVNLNDGKYGTMGWAAQSPKDSKKRPWLKFTFDQPQHVGWLKISNNREDASDTDYLEKMNSQFHGDFVVKVKLADGQWKTMANTRNISNLRKQSSQRAVETAKLQMLVDELVREGPQPSFIGRFVEPGKTFVLRRGSPESRGDEVYPAGLTELNGELDLPEDADGQLRRKAFSDWLTAEENPLTARVMVNRLWHHIFGQGIVATTSDFGEAGTPPTHPELLDWLASEFVNPSSTSSEPVEAWSVKHIIGTIVMSHAFRQASLPREECLAVDAGAMLWWRFPPRRIEAEVIRDAILKASGALDPSIGGKSYRIHNIKKRYAQWEVVDNYSAETWRRLIYQERMRRVDDKNFTAFDFPDCGQIRARRPVSTTPLQALNLMNSEFVVQQSKLIAERARKNSGGDLEAAVDRCFELVLNRQAASDDMQVCLDIAENEGLEIVCRALINSNEFAFLP